MRGVPRTRASGRWLDFVALDLPVASFDRGKLHTGITIEPDARLHDEPAFDVMASCFEDLRDAPIPRVRSSRM